jgi:ribosome-associated heat shock protein Hsp15
LSSADRKPPGSSRRLDQWLWFARLVKTRSLAARLCSGGAITLNGLPLGKPNRILHIGDVVTVPQGAYRRTVRVFALGWRRGPANEARLLYEEIAAPVRLADLAAVWQPLLAESDLEP